MFRHLFLSTLFLFALLGCKGGDKMERLPEKRTRKAGRNDGAPPLDMGVPFEGKDFEKLRKAPLVFPHSPCGDIVKRIFECEKERVGKKYPTQKALRRAKLFSIEMKFKAKMDKYLQHCAKSAAGLEPAKIKECLALSCPLMDQCMKTLGQSKKNSGKI